MGLPSIKPPIRVLIRTRPVQLQKIHPLFDQADTKLIEMLCHKQSITDQTKICHLITRLSDEKKLERADIIFDYGSTAVAPTVIAYDVTVDGPDLVVKQLSHPRIRQIVNQAVEAHRLINLETGQNFPSRPDIRAETRRKRLLSKLSESKTTCHSLGPNCNEDRKFCTHLRSQQ
jgi:hypothetical protein